MNCTPCRVANTLYAYSDSIVIGTADALTNYYILIKDNVSGKLLRYTVTSDYAGLITLTFPYKTIFDPTVTYTLWVTAIDSECEVPIEIDCATVTCIELHFKSLVQADGTQVQLPSQVIVITPAKKCLCITPSILKALKPYKAYSVLLTQYVQQSGLLIAGIEYTITDCQTGDDFTNVGASINATGVIFIATGTTPTNWTNLSSLTTNQPPAVDVLENGIGNIVWTRNINGVYAATLANAFPQFKTYHNVSKNDVFNYLSVWVSTSTIQVQTTIPTVNSIGSPVQNPVSDGLLLITPFEIRVYS